MTPLGSPSSRPARYRGLAAETGRWACTTYLRLAGWTIDGDWPAIDRAVLLAAPHTSNWDGVIMLAAAGHYRIRLRWMGKKSLTTGPFGWLVRWAGCVPIDRSASNDVVRAMTAAFAAAPELILAIPPEGTRGLTREWKSGFYHIAVAAGVPIIVTVLDYGTKTIRIANVFAPTGDYATDLPRLRGYYRAAQGRNRQNFSADD
ncbi:MAG: hypothetical protein B7Y45_08315 [Sphingomonas sp. 28-66-16]|nr:MAG: hypothetical protein B7Y45_08315 [Sphingomonas sp. 28-66-16]